MSDALRARCTARIAKIAADREIGLYAAHYAKDVAELIAEIDRLSTLTARLLDADALSYADRIDARCTTQSARPGRYEVRP